MIWRNVEASKSPQTSLTLLKIALADATDNSLTAVLTGSSNDIDIVQKSGSDTGCPSGSSCSGIIDVSFVTSNANIDIVQKDDND